MNHQAPDTSLYPRSPAQIPTELQKRRMKEKRKNLIQAAYCLDVPWYTVYKTPALLHCKSGCKVRFTLIVGSVFITLLAVPSSSVSSPSHKIYPLHEAFVNPFPLPAPSSPSFLRLLPRLPAPPPPPPFFLLLLLPFFLLLLLPSSCFSSSPSSCSSSSTASRPLDRAVRQATHTTKVGAPRTSQGLRHGLDVELADLGGALAKA